MPMSLSRVLGGRRPSWERERLWELVNEKNRGLAPLFHRGVVGRYDVYQRHARREIPVVILEPSDHV
jgi:hypothetical protein